MNLSHHTRIWQIVVLPLVGPSDAEKENPKRKIYHALVRIVVDPLNSWLGTGNAWTFVLIKLQTRSDAVDCQ